MFVKTFCVLKSEISFLQYMRMPRMNLLEIKTALDLLASVTEIKGHSEVRHLLSTFSNETR